MSLLIILGLVALAYQAYQNRELIRSFLFLEPRINNQSMPAGKNFQFAIYDDSSVVEDGVWYRLKDWKYPPNYLRMEHRTRCRRGAVSPYEEKVMGTEFEGRWKNLLLLGDQPDFQMYLERELDNALDRNAVKVMCSATVDGNALVKQIGYVQKNTAAALKGIEDIEIGSASVSFPTNSQPLILKILIV